MSNDAAAYAVQTAVEIIDKRKTSGYRPDIQVRTYGEICTASKRIRKNTVVSRGNCLSVNRFHLKPYSRMKNQATSVDKPSPLC